MASAADLHSILYRGDALAKSFQPRFDPTKRVKRYFPGQVPDYVVAGDDEEQPLAVEQVVEISALPLEEEPIEEEARYVKRPRREVIVAPVVVPPQQEEEEATPGEKRERLRLKAIEARKKEEEELHEKMASAALQLEDIEEDEEDEEDDEDEVQNLKPVFVPAARRAAIKDRQELEEIDKEARQKEEEAERKKDSRRLLVETVRLADEEDRLKLVKPQNALLIPAEMPDDSDTVDEETEYERWKIRELERIRRDKAEATQRQKEQEALEARRLMTEDERREDDKRLDALKPAEAKKGKYVFLQKYYHKGAFFQDLATSGAEPLYLRDFNQAVTEDAIDKKVLPKPMQVRRGQFGKAGQVKHTHLAAVDTTDFSSAWAQTSRQNLKHQGNLAGTRGSLDIGKESKSAASSSRVKKSERRYSGGSYR